MDIYFFNRESGQVELEKVYGAQSMEFLYGKIGSKGLLPLLIKKEFSRLYGALQSTTWSTKKIPTFIRNFSIKMSDYKESSFHSFNDFFIREFKEGKRSFVSNQSQLAAFAEARYTGYETAPLKKEVLLKGTNINVSEILNNERWNSTFEGGPLLVARLCPVDYHRFHYPDDGELLESYVAHGPLHSVNPVALKKLTNILSTNERVVHILETKNFGKLAYIEVGAICVGKIVQTHREKYFKRGDQKGYFLFGGSTVIVLGEKGRWKPSADILQNSERGLETLVKLGDEVGAL